MSPIARRARITLSFLGVVALALSPFAVYGALDYFRDAPLSVGTELPAVSPSPEQSPSPFPSPTPSPSPSITPRPIHSDITVEVQNAGGPKGAGRRLADSLTESGFKVVRVADHQGSPVNGILVYYKTDAAKGQAVASEIDEFSEAKPLPPGSTTTADVLVLVGK